MAENGTANKNSAAVALRRLGELKWKKARMGVHHPQAGGEIGSSGRARSLRKRSAKRPTACTNRTEIVASVALALKTRYGDFDHHNRRNPLEELLFILCSVQTQESNYRRTFGALRARFPSFAHLAKARIREIEQPLLSGGLYRNKARAIHRLCRAIAATFGDLTLAPLRQMSDEECENFLTSLPGVGLKVARCVMLYSLDRDVFPVDTHCWRICQRLGWVRATSRSGECKARDMERLQEKIPPSLRFSLHVNLISLGREVCLDSKPRCGECPVSSHCARGRLHEDGGN